jgi:hypothetical protein
LSSTIPSSLSTIFTEASDDMLVCFWSAPFTETVLTAAEEA